MLKQRRLFLCLLPLFGIALLLPFSLRPAGAEIGPVRDTVEVFVTSWCPYCDQLQSFLRRQNVKFTTYDIERDVKGFALHQQLGGGGVPVIKIGSTVFRGFNEAQLTAYLMERRRQ